jgi:hypothetical protein
MRKEDYEAGTGDWLADWGGGTWLGAGVIAYGKDRLIEDNRYKKDHIHILSLAIS